MTDEQKAIDGIFRAHGLGGINEADTVRQMACLVMDHDHFRELLGVCDPHLRREMYEAMRPHLAFRPWTLDAYMAEAGRLAEAKHLPVLQPDGALKQYYPPEVRIAQQAVEAALAEVELIVTCVKCTRQASFFGERKADCVMAAREAGWIYDVLGDAREICPDCPAVRN